jgi:hypothetical protein
MKPALAIIVAIVVYGASAHAIPERPLAEVSEFVGSTPCDEPIRRFLGIANTSCEQITWNLSLSTAPATQRFELRLRYRMPVPGSPNHLDAGIEKQLSGAWRSAAGTGAHAARTIYTLSVEGRSLSLAKFDRDLLHILTDASRLMVGNAGWSYTLNRRETSVALAPRNMETLVGAGNGVRDEVIAGAFEGRTPCREISTLLNLEFDSGCTKLKWGLALSGDPATGRATYQLGGTVYRNGELQRATPRTGTWSMLRDRSSGALLHRLEQVEPGRDLLLMRADAHVLFFLDSAGNALVGNESFSYTLNRAPHRSAAGDPRSGTEFLIADLLFPSI